MEHLTRLAPIIRLAKRRSDVQLVISGHRHTVSPLVLRFLRLMGVDTDRIVFGRFGVRADWMLYTPVDCFVPISFALKELRHVVFEHNRIAPNRTALPLFVFSERLDGVGSDRRPGNYHELKAGILAVVAQRGWRHTTVTEVTDPVTVARFAEASVVFGVHGANLAPVAFMRNGSALVEIAGWQTHPLCYYHVAGMVGAAYFPIFYDAVSFFDPPRFVRSVEVLEQIDKAMNFTSSG
jgi:hypothetical protein